MVLYSFRMMKVVEKSSSFFQYRPGNVGIIISIPHGGLKDDRTIPERSDGFEIPNNLQDINVSFKNIKDNCAHTLYLYKDFKSHL